MRTRRSRDGLSVHAVAGTHVVALGFNITGKSARKGLLGFAIHRTDHTENEAYWLRGMKTFQEVEPSPPPGSQFSLLEHPAQTFQWGDYTAKPDHRYTYQVVAMGGKPTTLKRRESVKVEVRTEDEGTGTHAVYFNRGAAGSQAYALKFGNRPPDKVPGDRAFVWLSRGLKEAMVAFIRQAADKHWGVRAAVYEFNYAPVLDEFKAAERRTGDVRIVYDARDPVLRATTEKALKIAGLDKNKSTCTPRTAGKSYISHNKFIVLLHNGRPVQVWTGSTNITTGGIFGHSNVGHIVRDRRVAAAYLAYWEHLHQDAEPKNLRPWNEDQSPVPAGAPMEGVTPVFSPRPDLTALEWYAKVMDGATRSVNLTAAFGVNKLLAAVLEKEKDYLRYLLLETAGENYRTYARDRDVQVAVGRFLEEDVLHRWVREKLTGLNVHVKYIHTKYMLVDPLGTDPITITGSANFSDASTKNNDENMLVIRGNQRVADIYLGEFMRLFNHFYFRYLAAMRRSRGTARSVAYLDPTDSWVDRYFKPGSGKSKQRRLFA